MSSEQDLRDYLLGRRDDGPSESIETRALDDEEYFQTIRSIEDDLFDQFARGQLSDGDRTAFLQRYGEQSERIAFAKALANRSSNVTAIPARRWTALAAAAAVVTAVTAAIVMRQPVASPTAAIQRAVRSMDVDVVLGGSRSASEPPQIIVPSSIATIVLRVRLNPADRYDNYVMTLHSKSVAWSSSQLHASMEAGDLIVKGSVPANVLASGSYELGVTGGGEDLGFTTLEVRRQQ